MTQEQRSRNNIKETGIRITEYDCASIFEYNMGLQARPQSKQELFTNSKILVEFLLKHGLIVKKDGTTNDIISVDYSRGTKSTEQRIAWFRKSENPKMLEYADKLENGERLNDVLDTSVVGLETIPKAEIREKTYEKGLLIYDKKGNVHVYRRLYRSAGLAKKGKCIFIKDRLYKIVRNYMRMNAKDIENEFIPLVELEAYMSLISSKNESSIQIDPKSILVLNDVDSYFKTTVLSVEKEFCDEDEQEHLVAKRKDNYEVKNTLFDGQGLISTSLFDDEHKKGFILLRQHMFKVACFKTNIELFFRDKLGENWKEVELTDMFGRKIKAGDVKLITTDNAIKWHKFPEFSMEHWIKCVNECDNWFGIVKSDHKSKDIELQRMSYQMVNSLDYETITDDFRYSTKKFIYDLKTDTDKFIEYLKNHASSSNRYGAMYTLAINNKALTETRMFREFRSDVTSKIGDDAKKGRVYQNGDNLTFVGSPYAMLLHAIGEDVENDDTLQPEKDVIQCYTTRFKNNEYLAVFRSPHNAQNNIGYLHNVYSEKMERYFSFSENILAINVRHTDYQDRLNGCDFDSDMGFVTNQKDIVKCAKRCYKECFTIVNNVPQSKKKYRNNFNSYAEVDNAIADSQTWIGESSNLSQLSQTYMHSVKTKAEKKVYSDICAILSVVAQIAIDSAKRSFAIDVSKEIKYLRKKLNADEMGYPKFWSAIHPSFSNEKVKRLRCPMNRLENFDFRVAPRTRIKVEMEEILKNVPLQKRAKCTAKALLRRVNDYAKFISKCKMRLLEEDANYSKESFNRDCYTAKQSLLWKCKSYNLQGERGEGIYSYIFSLIYDMKHADITEVDKEWYANMTDTPLTKGTMTTGILNVLADLNPKSFAGAFRQLDF